MATLSLLPLWAFLYLIALKPQEKTVEGPLAISLTVVTTTNDRPSYQTLELGAFESAGIEVSADSVLVQSASEFLAALEVVDGAGYAVIGPSENKNLGEDLLVRVR